MRILHCCLAAFYVDNYSYQENLLPKHHLLAGHSVKIVASTEIFTHEHKLGYLAESSEYVNEFGIEVKRLSYVRWLPSTIARKIRIYVGLSDTLNSFRPDIIFIHDTQFLDIFKIVSYVKKFGNVKVFADGHADYINSGRNFFSKYILHKLIYRFCAKMAEPYIECFYATTPLRAKFINETYKIDKKKIGLLLMGYDDSLVCKNDHLSLRESTRAKYNIGDGDFLIATGGKFDRNKNINLLINAVANLNHPNLKLLIFGSPTVDYREEFKNLISISPNIIYAGWAGARDVFAHFLAADLACFPGTHSVLWEQAVGLGIPALFRYFEGFEHIDLGGNCLMLYEETSAEIERNLSMLITNPNALLEMKRVALAKGSTTFSYSEIARRAILCPEEWT